MSCPPQAVRSRRMGLAGLWHGLLQPALCRRYEAATGSFATPCCKRSFSAGARITTWRDGGWLSCRIGWLMLRRVPRWPEAVSGRRRRRGGLLAAGAWSLRSHWLLPSIVRVLFTYVVPHPSVRKQLSLQAWAVLPPLTPAASAEKKHHTCCGRRHSGGIPIRYRRKDTHAQPNHRRPAGRAAACPGARRLRRAGRDGLPARGSSAVLYGFRGARDPRL